MSVFKNVSSFWGGAVTTWYKTQMWNKPKPEQLEILKSYLARGDVPLTDDLLLAGWRVYSRSYWRNKRRPSLAETPTRKLLREANARYYKAMDEKWAIRDQKVEAFDRIVEALDLIKVGQKLLGDCTKADLLRASAELKGSAGELLVRSELYRELAKLVGPTGTVRQAANRGKIVALLTHTFKE